MKIKCFSTALFSSWMFLEDYGVCFDAGDGLTGILGSKSRKIKHLFVSHADRDHVSGLLQFNSLNGSAEPVIYYPKDSGSFPALRDFCSKFDPQTTGSTWIPVNSVAFEIAKGLFVKPHVTDHSKIVDQVKSLGFILFRRNKKLKPEFVGQDIKKLRESVSDNDLFDIVDDNLFGYSGDGCADESLWTDVKIVAHESTFLTEEDSAAAHSNHADLPNVMRMFAKLQPKVAILYHFSSRYTKEEILSAVKKQVELHNIDFPVHVVLPGGVCELNV